MAVTSFALIGYYIYSIMRPGVNKSSIADKIVTEMKFAIKENQLRATLEKDKIGMVKGVFESRLQDTKKIEDREERLKSLIGLHKELDV